MSYLRPEEEIRLLARMASTATKIAEEQILQPNAKARKGVKEARMLLIFVATKRKIRDGAIQDSIFCSKSDINDAVVYVDKNQGLSALASTILQAFNTQTHAPPQQRVTVARASRVIASSLGITTSTLGGHATKAQGSNKLIISKGRHGLMYLWIRILKENDKESLCRFLCESVRSLTITFCYATDRMRKDPDFRTWMEDICSELGVAIPA